MAVDERFELPVPVSTIAFKAIAIDRSANPPGIQLSFNNKPTYSLASFALTAISVKTRESDNRYPLAFLFVNA